MKPLISFLPVLWVCLCSSCQKETFEDTSIQGKVLTYGTEEAIRHPPVRVVVYEEKEVSTWGSGNTYTPVAEAMSQEDGSFELSHSLSNQKKYFLGVDENTVNSRYYIWPSYGNIDLPRHKIHGRGGTQKMHYYLVARGWVKFHLLTKDHQDGDTYSFAAGGGWYEAFYGATNKFSTIDFAGNMEHKVYATIETGGEYYPREIKVFVPAFDTINQTVYLDSLAL